MSQLADLHIHTHFSDSTSSPEEVVQQAVDANLSCIAITDHDTFDGVTPTQEAAEDHPLEVIAGVELSSEIQNKDIHILGYFPDHKNTLLEEALNKMQEARVDRMTQMIEKLRSSGVDNISLEEVCSLAQSRSVGRPHLAKVLVEKGWVKSIKEAFDRYLAEGAPAYVGKYKQSPYRAIELIEESGGVSVLAHPMLTQVDELIPDFVKHGLRGLEVYYANCSPKIIASYKMIAEKHGLILTGGSDAHGEAKKHTFVGKSNIPYDLVETLKACFT